MDYSSYFSEPFKCILKNGPILVKIPSDNCKGFGCWWGSRESAADSGILSPGRGMLLKKKDWKPPTPKALCSWSYHGYFLEGHLVNISGWHGKVGLWDRQSEHRVTGTHCACLMDCFRAAYTIEALFTFWVCNSGLWGLSWALSDV